MDFLCNFLFKHLILIIIIIIVIIDDIKNRQYELLVNIDRQRHSLCLETNLLVLFFSGFIAFGAVLLFLSLQMDEAVGFVQR